MESATNLTSGNIVQRLVALASPLIAASFIQMAYTMTDMAWLGRLGSEPVAAVGAASFIVWLASSSSYITKMGAEITISQSLGSGNRLLAKSYANHVVTLTLLISLGVALTVLGGASLFMDFFSLQPSISSQGAEYLRLVAPGLFFTCCNATFGGIYYGTGNSKTPFRIAAIGLVCNMILDPLLIFGKLGLPAWGTNGAAIATTLSQLLVFLIYASNIFSSRFRAMGRLSLITPLQRALSFRILKLGLPVTGQNMFFAILSMTLAQLTSQFGHVGVAVFSVGAQIEAISWMTAGGFSTALGTFVGQNYGAGKFDRILRGFKASLWMAGSFGAVATIAFWVAGEQIFGIFISDPITREAGGDYLHIMAISQLFMVIELVTAGAFNGVGRTSPPAVMGSLLNALRIPMAYTLVLIPALAIRGVWWSITISSVLKGGILLGWFYFSVLRPIARGTFKGNNQPHPPTPSL